MSDSTGSIGSLFDFFERLITDFTWRRIGVVISVLVLVVVVVFSFERYTRTFVLSRLEKQASLLEKMLNVRDKVKKAGDDELEKVFEGLRLQLGRIVQGTSHDFQLPDGLEKAIYLALPWALLIFMIIVTTRREGRANAVGGIIVCAAPLIFLGLFIPDFKLAWVNRWFIPWMLPTLLIAFILIYQKRKGK